ncbi:MAG: hypothetical protein WA097_05785 [Candidatus Hydromicrobium sp.]
MKWLSTKDAKEKKWIDTIASIIIGAIIIGEAFLSNKIWGTKTEPYVRLTWGHLTFPLIEDSLLAHIRDMTGKTCNKIYCIKLPSICSTL